MYKRIMVAVDGSPTSLRGLDEALALARDQGAQLFILHVIDEYAMVQFPAIDGGGLYLGDMMRMQVEAGRAILASAFKTAAAAGVKADGEALECFTGPVWQCIVDAAARWKPDLLVLGTHGRRGFNRLFMGSDAERVLRLATMPVLLVRAPEAQAAAAGGGQARMAA
jgi:nucleotide-binding universal stress UspA family protein